MYGPVSTVAGHRGCTQGLLAICVSVCVLYLELQRMGRWLIDERMDGHLQCWAKGAGERSWPFSSHLAPWIMLQEPRVVPLTALLIKILTLWCGYVCAEDLLCKRILAFKWENCSSLLKKTWVTQLQAFLLTVVSVYWAIYTLYPVCLGGCLLQTRVGYNLCCRKTASVCEACRCRMENSHDLIGTKPSCHGDYSEHLCPRLPYSGKWRWRKAGKTIQTCGETADVVKRNTVLEKWKPKERRSSCVYFKKFFQVHAPGRKIDTA